MPILV